MESWFSEQIRIRKLSDEEVMARAYVDMAGVVMGRKAVALLNDELEQTRNALDLILKYFGIRIKEFPSEIKDLNKDLSRLLHPFGVMTRNVRLTKGWHKDATGPMLGFTKENGTPIALMPAPGEGYVFQDTASGKTLRITSGNESLISEDAICFYKPFPIKKLNALDILRFIIENLSSNDVIFMVVATALATYIGLRTPRITYWLYSDALVKSENYSSLAAIGFFFIAVSMSMVIINTLKTLILSRIQRKTLLSLESAAMMRVLSLPSDFFKEYSSGDISLRMTYITSLGSTMIQMLVSTGLTSVFSFAYVTEIFRFAPGLVIPSLFIILINTGFSVFASLLQIKISRDRMEATTGESGMTYALISGIQKIKLAGAEKRAFSRWSKKYIEMAKLTFDPPAVIKLNVVISSAIGLIGTVVLYYTALKNNLNVAEYSAFTSAYGMLYGALSGFFGIALDIAGIRPYLKMVEPMFMTLPEVSGNKQIVDRLRGNIELAHVSFRYDENSPYVLDDISLKIKEGQYIAVAGKTGCGKSTLMRLLIGFETPDKGTIFYDGKDLKSMDMQSLRRHIGTVLQSGKLMNGSIYENICITEPDLNMDDVWEAAEMAGLADDIREMPMGMQTVISEGSGSISGGQKQRLMIARAVCTKPRILMFDEATSALDNKTQAQVTKALDGLKCTRIVIAHRLSTIRNADRILVIDGGKIVEDGTYEELVNRKGYFADLVERQRLDK